MIGSFADKDTQKLFFGERVRHFSDVEKIAIRKLDMLDAAVVLSDLLVPPGNRLEQLSGNRKGQYSIRINDQWRICFLWKNNQAENVEIVDYH